MNSLTHSLYRFVTLLDALRKGPQTRADLFVLVRDAYPVGPSMRPMIDRDVRALRELGIVIEISRTRPPTRRIETLNPGVGLEAPATRSKPEIKQRADDSPQVRDKINRRTA
ncbi:hypothetical protein F8S13_01065 [Chloroflexia bacterium SDU3-3]|nr:hypothetical protein F8S13_01065 [Chloroflexia bacterium SDU3-3]